MAQTWFVKDGKNVYNKGVGMKVYVYQQSEGTRLLLKTDKCVWFKGVNDSCRYDYVGELDLDIHPPKKTVRKEVEIKDRCCYHNSSLAAVSAFVPANAKNIKITYDVDE